MRLTYGTIFVALVFLTLAALSAAKLYKPNDPMLRVSFIDANDKHTRIGLTVVAIVAGAIGFMMLGGATPSFIKHMMRRSTGSGKFYCKH